MGPSPHARSTRRCSGVPSADPRLTDLGTPESPSAGVPVRPPLRWGLLAWLTLCVAYTVLDLAGLLDGLFVPVPLILALVLARVGLTDARFARGSRHVAAVVAAACVPAAAFVWRFGFTVADLSPGLLTAALLALGALIVLLLVPAVRVRFLRVFGLDPDSPVHRVVAIAFVITVLDSIVLFLELSKAGPVEIPFYPSDPFISLMTDLALALAGVGLGLTRGVRATLARLDLRRSSLRQLGVALVVAAVLQLGVTLLEHLESVLLPTVAALEDRFGYDFVGLPPWVGAVLTSVAAGVGEEVLFRGALQPRLGIVLTAVLFGALHVQYQVPGMVVIVVIGLALGLLKERTSTTFTVFVHVFYDIGAFFLPEF